MQFVNWKQGPQISTSWCVIGPGLKLKGDLGSLRPGSSKVVEWPPPQQRTAPSEKASKTQLKTHLFRQASDHFQSHSAPLCPHVRLCPVPGRDCHMPQCCLCVCVMCQVLQLFLDGATRLVPIIHRENSDTEALVCVEGDKERKRERERAVGRDRELCHHPVYCAYRHWFVPAVVFFLN